MAVETEYIPSEADIKPFKRNALKYRAIRWLVKRFPANIEVLGQENIQRARELLQEEQYVTALGNHKGTADTYDIFSAAIQNDFEDLIEKTYFGMSIAYTRGPLGRVLKGVVNFAEIVPHTMTHPDKTKINAVAKYRQQNREPGTIWETMPEGTRVEGKMERARWGASVYWHGEEGSNESRWILPAGIQGTENQMPKGSGLKGFLKFLVRGGRDIPARFIFGEPVRVAHIDKAADCYSDGDPDRLKRLNVNLVMLLVTRLQLANEGEKYVSDENIKLIEELEIHPLSQALKKLSNLGEVVVKQEERLEGQVEERDVNPRLRFEPGSAAI